MKLERKNGCNLYYMFCVYTRFGGLLNVVGFRFTKQDWESILGPGF